MGEPGEEALEGAEAGALGADPEGIAVFLAPVPEVALVAFEDRLGDPRGQRQIAFDGPEQEYFERIPAALNAVWGVVAHGEKLQIGGRVAGEAVRGAGWKFVGSVAAPPGGVAPAEVAGGLIAFFACHGVVVLFG